jgi:Ca-activated chloride channel homolog
MRFQDNWAFQLIWFLPLMWVIYRITLRQLEAKLKKSFGEKTWRFLTASVSVSGRRWKFILQNLFLLFAILALARPQTGGSKQEVKSQGFELMLVVDVSESMLSEDVRPSRLEQLKIDMSRLMSLSPGNKVGLIAFAGSAALLSPLTSDASAIRMYLESLSTMSVSAQGTNFEEALDQARAAFERGGIGGAGVQESVRVTRAILVASDGEDHEPGAQEKAKALAKDGIKIFGLAYGTEKGAPIPVRDSLGYQRGYKKDKSGQTILTKVNGDALREISQSGQGGFYFATPGGNYLNSLVQDFEKLEKAEFDSALMIQYDEKFQIFLILAIIFAVLELVIGDRRQNFKLWRGRFEVPPA